MPTQTKGFVIEEIAYAICYWQIHHLTRAFDADKAEYAAEKAIRWLASNFTAEEALSYIKTYCLYESKFWGAME